MAILNSLILNGSGRVLNKLYVKDIAIGGSAEFTDLTASGNITATGTMTATGNITTSGAFYSGINGLFINNKKAIFTSSASDAWLRINDGKPFTSGVYFGSSLIRTDGELQVGSNGAYLKSNSTSTTVANLIATTGAITTLTGQKGTFDNFYVLDTLRATKYELDSVTALGGSFYVAPVIICSANCQVIISAISGNTVTAAIYDTTAITSHTVGGVQWTQYSKIKISGRLGSVPLGTVTGTLTAQMNTTANRINCTFTFDNASALSVKTYGTSEVHDFAVMIYEKGVNSTTSYPVGIYMTGYGTNNSSYIDMYQGEESRLKPRVRLGKLDDLDSSITVGGVAPSGWGLYADNVFLNGTINSTAGIIGGFTLGSTKLYSNNHSAYNTAATGVYIGTDYISFGSGGVTYFKNDGTGKVGPWTLSTTYFRNGNIASATNTTVAGVYLGTDGLNISNGTAETTSYITKSAVNIGNKLTWNGTTLSVEGTITATGGTIGGWTVGSSSLYNTTNSMTSTGVGIYLGTDGIRNYKDANTYVNITAGKITAKAVDLTGKITATSGQIGKFTITSSYIHAYQDNSNQTAATNAGFGGNQAFWAGSTTSNSAPFRVSYGGALVATSATITGEITANSGSIAGFHITSTSNAGTSANGGHRYTSSLYRHSGDGTTYEYEVGIKGDATENPSSANTSNGNLAFYVKRISKGAQWSTATDMFYVTHAGKMYCKDADVEGKITATSGTIGGCSITDGVLQVESANIVSLDASKLTTNTIYIGGKNLLKSSYVNVSNSAYPTVKINLVDEDKPVAGETVTIQIKGTLASTKTEWGVYNSGGTVVMANITPADYNSTTGIYTKTFEWVITKGSTTASNTQVYIYPLTNSQSGTSSIEWVMLERGNQASGWSVSPNEVGGFNINGNSIYSGTYGSDSSIYLSIANMASKAIAGRTGADWRLTVGSHFGVTNSGAVYCNSANITGVINADTGTFGGSSGFTIASGKMYSGSHSTLADTTNDGVYVGTDGISLGKGKFKVTSAGAITASSGVIGGFNITSSTIYSGTHSAWDTDVDGIYIGTTGIAGGPQGNWWLWNDGSAQIGALTLSADGTLAVPAANITGTLTADQIAVNTISASKLAVSDPTNYITVNEMNSASAIVDNHPFGASGANKLAGGYITKTSYTSSYIALSPYVQNTFKEGDELYYSITVKGTMVGSDTEGTGRVGIWFYGTAIDDKTYKTYIYGPEIRFTTSDVVYTGTITINATGASSGYYAVGFTDTRSTRQQVYIKKASLRKKSDTNLIIDGAITADKISVNSLNAISTTIGTGTNKITLGANATNASIYYGKSTLDDTANDGFYIGTDGISLGKGKFKVTNAGAITASSGAIGQFNIASNSLTYGTWGANNSVMLCSTGTSTKKNIGGSGSDVNGWVITAGSTFGVTKAGVLYCTNAHISGEITATSGKIGQWTTYSNYMEIESDVTRVIDGNNTTYHYKVTLSDGSNANGDVLVITKGASGSQSWPFFIRSDGYLYCNNAKISGEITSTTGCIGGFDIANDSLGTSQEVLEDTKSYLKIYSSRSKTQNIIEIFEGVYNMDAGDWEKHFTVAGTGDVTISNTAPLLTIKNTTNGTAAITLERGTNANANWKIINNGGNLYFQTDYTTTHTNYYHVLTLAYNTGNATFKGSVTCTSLTQTSDERFKNILSYNYNKNKNLFMNIEPIEYTWKDSFSKDTYIHFGIGAQTLQKTVSSLGINNTSLINTSNPEQLGINYTELLTLSIPIVQSHERQIQELENRIAQLENEIKVLGERG